MTDKLDELLELLEQVAPNVKGLTAAQATQLQKLTQELKNPFKRPYRGG
jgi:hypothetical protein